jgi:hypothetical protein
MPAISITATNPTLAGFAKKSRKVSQAPAHQDQQNTRQQLTQKREEVPRHLKAPFDLVKKKHVISLNP